MRYAVYLTPPPDAPLAKAAEAWLGRSAFGADAPPAAAPAVAKAEVPARYGFHGTMRAPFRLADGASEAGLVEAFAAFCTNEPVLRTTLAVSRLSRFVALTAPDQTDIASAAMRALVAFEPWRAPLSEAEWARRKPDQLDARGLALLQRWGYPLVEDRFTFHMTLSGPMEAADAGVVEAAARQHFSAAVMEPVPLAFALFREDEVGGPFHVIATAPEIDARNPE